MANNQWKSFKLINCHLVRETTSLRPQINTGLCNLMEKHALREHVRQHDAFRDVWNCYRCFFLPAVSTAAS